jgi:hypothetical protein
VSLCGITELPGASDRTVVVDRDRSDGEDSVARERRALSSVSLCGMNWQESEPECGTTWRQLVSRWPVSSGGIRRPTDESRPLSSASTGAVTVRYRRKFPD